MLGLSLSSKGHDFRTNFDIKWEYVIKQNHTRYSWVWTSYLWFVSRRLQTTLWRGQDLRLSEVRWRCIFAQNIGLQVPHSGVCKTHYSFHIQIHSCQLPKSREIIIAWLQKNVIWTKPDAVLQKLKVGNAGC